MTRGVRPQAALQTETISVVPDTEAPRAQVLVVDDEENVLITTGAILELDGYAVTTASSAAAALELLSRRAFDVVVSDLRIGDAAGLHVLSEAQRFSPDTATVVVTGYATLDAATEAIRSGVYDFLLKPCDPEQLRLVVARGIERRRLSHQIRDQLRVVEQANTAIQSTVQSVNVTLDQRMTEATAGLARRIAKIERLSQDAREAEKQIRLQAARLQALADASQSFAETRLDLSTLLNTVAQRVAELVGDGCLIFLLSDDEQRLDPIAMYHPNPEAQALADQVLAGAHASADSGTTGGGVAAEVLRTGAAVLVPKLPPLPAGSPHQSLGAAVVNDVAYLPYLQQFPVHSFLAVPLRVQGRVMGVMAMWQDVSDGSYTTADQVFLQDLADRAALAIENARLYSQVLATLNTRDLFLASAAHDLKGPLTSLKGNAQLLLRQLAPAPPNSASSSRSPRPPRDGTSLAGAPSARRDTSAMERLSRIDRAANQMARMLDQLLDLARLPTGQPLELDRQPMDLVAVAHERIAEHQQSAGDITLHCVAAVPALAGSWDRVRIERVLDNLLGNALKYTLHGGEVVVELTQEARDGHPWASLQVRDQGLGIPAADLPHIFERFHRGRNVRDRISGTGIGLASARQIVELHGGTIEAMSEEGKGTVITVLLPLDAPG